MARNFQRITLRHGNDYYRDADTAIQIPNLRQEYTRLRKVENERLRALARAGYEESRTYQYNKGRYPGASGLSDQEIARLMPDLARAIMAESGTVGGMRRIEARQLETMRDMGYDFLNKKNIKAFREFMEDMKDTDDGARWYDTQSKEDDEGRILAVQERFEEWLETGE